MNHSRGSDPPARRPFEPPCRRETAKCVGLTHMPNSERCVPVYVCAVPYAANGGGGRQFSLVVHTGSALAEFRAGGCVGWGWDGGARIIQFLVRARVRSSRSR